MVKLRIGIYSCSLILAMLVLLFLPEHAFAQNATVCDGYARDFAQRNSRGAVASGAARGAIGGALIGGIVGRGRGARRGAAIAGGAGAVLGGAQQSRDYTSLFNEAFRRCMGE